MCVLTSYVFQYSSRVLIKTFQHFRTPDEAAHWHTGPFGRFQFCDTRGSAMTDPERMTGRATRLRDRPQPGPGDTNRSPHDYVSASGPLVGTTARPRRAARSTVHVRCSPVSARTRPSWLVSALASPRPARRGTRRRSRRRGGLSRARGRCTCRQQRRCGQRCDGARRFPVTN